MTDIPEVEFFFDVVSPYSYLASTQFPGLVERTGARVRWRPFFLAGVMQATGNTPPAQLLPRGRWLYEDVKRWADQYGVPLRLNSVFPLNTLSAQRTLLATEEIHGYEAMEKLAVRLFAAAWAEDEDVSNGDTIAFCVNRCGLDVKKLMHRDGEDELKQKLKDVTAEAVKRGAFGAPTFFVGDTMFFGNDRLHHLETHLLSLEAG
jgi:2-hydroxychromene-2-carboxylate isomerase